MNKFEPCYARYARTSLLFIVAGTMLSVSNSYASRTADVARASIAFRNGDIHSLHLTRSAGVAIAESDMIIGSADEFFHTKPKRLTRGLSNNSYGRIWPNGVVPYRIQDDLSDSAEQRIRDAIAHWNSIQAITMVERTASNLSAYPNFIDFVNDDRCASWIGFMGNGGQQIYSGDNCSTGTMIHEIGHALGLLHEHTRSDRDQYISVNLGSVDAQWHKNFEILEGNNELGAYDYGSIMHYGEFFFSNDGNPTIEPLFATDEVIGQRVETSAGDKAAIADLYKSNIAVVASSDPSAAVGSTVEVSFQITNNTSVGTHSLNINVPVPADSRLLSYASAAWTCSQLRTGEDISCRTPVLSASANSSVSINLSAPATPGQMLLDAQLSSRTLDTDLSDNNDSTSTTIVAAPMQSNKILSGELGNEPVNVPADDIPQIASAMDAGGGATDLNGITLSVLFLYATARLRRRGDTLRISRSD